MHVKLDFSFAVNSFIPAAEDNGFSTRMFYVCKVTLHTAEHWQLSLEAKRDGNMMGQLVTQRMQLSFRGNKCRSERSRGRKLFHA